MSASVGGIAVDIFQGLVQILGQETETWRVPGLDSYGARQLGNANGESRFRTINLETSDANANALILSMKALEGTIVTVIDSFGDTYLNVLVQRCFVGPDTKQAVLYQGSPGVRVKIDWQCLKT